MRSLGTCLQENKSIFSRKPLSILSTNLTSRILVRFVTNEHDCSVGITILSDFFEPLSEMSKCITPCDVVN